MNEINQKLKEYIETKIFPLYEKNEKGHGIDHINYVIRRSLEFAKQFSDINLDIVYTTAVFHDIAHHIDKDHHEQLSAKVFYEDNNMSTFFNEKERIIIKEAIEEHRASSKNIPRSDYGKIVSSADRSTNVKEFLIRVHAYSLKHYPEYNLSQILKRAYEHTSEKYGNQGYAKTYVEDLEYKKFIQDIKELLKDKEKFNKQYRKINNL